MQLLEHTDSQLYLLLTLPAGRDVASAVFQFVSAQARGCVDRPIASCLSIVYRGQRSKLSLPGGRPGRLAPNVVRTDLANMYDRAPY